MKEQAIIKKQTQLTNDIWKMDLTCELAKEAQPGQFVQVQVPGYYLRRPISIHRIDDNQISIIYKVVGDGTHVLSTLEEGQEVNVFGPLGTGFPVEKKDHVVLIGGGVGVPPLFQTAKAYLAQGTRVDVVLGFNDVSQVFLEEEFKSIGCNVVVATMDGSYGTKGTVMDAIDQNKIDVDFLLSCGPLPMLRALQNTYTNGYISLEARMACGIGACMGCVVDASDGGPSLRVCKDGPVFALGKVVLQ